MSISFRKVMVTEKTELLKYKAVILELFYKCFKKPMSEELWSWAYIDNPNGSPIVSLFFDEANLAGHHAVIPLRLSHKSKTIEACLSMTTMVDEPYRRYGVFVEQASLVYAKAEEFGYKLVCGFPNKNSAPGFRKRLGWNLNQNTRVVKFSYDQLQGIEKKNYYNNISFDTQNDENMRWRLSKPEQEYVISSNSILKKLNDDEYDVVFNGFDFSMLDKDVSYNVLIDQGDGVEVGEKQFDYLFGYRLFDSSLEGIEFKIDLIISDVF